MTGKNGTHFNRRDVIKVRFAHLHIKIGGFELDCPVVLDYYGTGSIPKKDKDGEYIYALPAGRRINRRGEFL